MVNVVVGVDSEILAVDVVHLVVVGKEEDEAALDHLILLLVTSAGCMAIAPVTIPKLVTHSHREVAMLALPEEATHSDPGRQAQREEEEEDVRCNLGDSVSYMMRTGINIPWTMQVNCTSPLNLHRLLTVVRMRRKFKTKQKTKKDIC